MFIFSRGNINSQMMMMMMLNEGRTSEQRVSVVLLQDATDARDVLDGKLEHDQLHRSLAHDVEVLQETAPHAHDSSTSVHVSPTDG